MDKPVGIGSNVWRINSNNRIYDKASRGGPIYRGYFQRYRIVGETRVSWILDDDAKLSKKGNDPRMSGIYTSVEAVDDACWIDANELHLRDSIRQCKDAKKLRAVREILGVEERPEVIPDGYVREKEGPCLKLKRLR